MQYKRRISEISDETGIFVQNLPKYLRVLINLGFVAKEWAVVLKESRDIKTGSIYALADNFMNFWYTFVYPVRSILEINRNSVVSRIATTYDQYLGRIFEDIAKQYLIDLNIAGKLPFAIESGGTGVDSWKQKGMNTYAIHMRSMLLH